MYAPKISKLQVVAIHRHFIFSAGETDRFGRSNALDRSEVTRKRERSTRQCETAAQPIDFSWVVDTHDPAERERDARARSDANATLENRCKTVLSKRY
ncbi:MAG: hypothetical protein IT473_11580 [Lysobacter sp.]|nr:hypothetical protein [Lysobacter sp.]